jgi:hypothetical protein
MTDENPPLCRLADGCGNSGDRCLRAALDIHILMVDELSISGNWHTDGRGADFAPNQAE